MSIARAAALIACLIPAVSPAVIAAGCRRTVGLGLPIDPETAGAVIALEHRGDPARLEVLAGTPEELTAAGAIFDEALEITVLSYDLPLAALGIPSGRLEAVAEGSALPRADRIAETIVDAEGPGAWRRVETARERVRAFRFQGAAKDPRACLEAGGCLSSIEPAGCTTRCPQPATPRAPLPPSVPVLPRCPAEWSARETGTIIACDAPPARLSCPPGSAELYDRSGCTPLGPPCDGDWPADLPAGRPIRYVRPGAAAGGSGGRDDPHPTLAAAIRAAAEGSIIALSRGVHRGDALIDRSVIIRGACAAETILTSTRAPVLSIGARDVELGRVSLEGSRVIVLRSKASLQLREATVTAGLRGIEVGGGAELVAQNLVVSGEAEATHGVLSTGTVIAEDLLLEDFDRGLHTEGSGYSASITRAIVRGTRAGESVGISAYGAGRLEVSRTIVQAWFDGIGLRETATATISDTIFDDTHVGVYAYSGAFAVMRALRMPRTTGFGIDVEMIAAGVAEDVLIEGPGIFGLVVQGGNLRANRIRVDGFKTGILSIGRSTAEVADFALTSADNDSASISLQNGGSLELTRAELLARTIAPAISVGGTSSARLFDLSVAGDHQGLKLQDGDVSGDRLMLLGGNGRAIWAIGESSVRLEDVVLEATGGGTSHGVYAGNDSSTVLERFQLRGSGGVGAIVERTGVLVLREGAIEGVRLAVCTQNEVLAVEVLDRVITPELSELLREVREIAHCDSE